MSNVCSAAEIAEKKRIALEKLRAKKEKLAGVGVKDSIFPLGNPKVDSKFAPSVTRIQLPTHSNTSSVGTIPRGTTNIIVSNIKPSFATVPALAVQQLASKTPTPITTNLKSLPNASKRFPQAAIPIPDISCRTEEFKPHEVKAAAPASVPQQLSNTFSKPLTNISKFSNATTENKASAFLNALKQSSVFTQRKEARDAAHPYMRPVGQNNSPQSWPQAKCSNNQQKNQSTNQPAPVFVKAVTCKVYMISTQRFAVQPSGYHVKLIEVFKTIPSKSYDANTRIWNFGLGDYQLLQQRVSGLKPDVVIGVIPKNILNLCRQPEKQLNRSCLASIEPLLAEKLMPFQQDGVCFAIAQHGRVMICDEMGLGKTYQALAIADFYKENWPLLICTTASTRESWSTHVRQLLPSVPLHYIQVLINQQQFIGDAKVLITSYNMMEKALTKLNERKFGVIIFDESHSLKNSKAKCTVVADRLAMAAKHVVLLSGTPALSRPLELFTQLQMIDRKFMNFIEFTSRYCDGKQTNFGWDATGQSNLQELNVVLKLKYMIRRLKADVLPELAEKSRETVVLDPALVWPNDDTKENLSIFAKNLLASKGREKEEILLKFYAETANVKTRAVCAYLKSLVRENIKFIVFGHHRVMLNAITECLMQAKVTFVRIDGSTSNEHRAEYIDEFQKKSSCRVAVLSLKACNSGITLTAAEMIVFAELDWNPSTLAQAESRAHRIGQAKPLICRYLMATKTADDVIWNMLKAKQDVLNRAGLLAENLQDATHTAAPTMSNKIEKYLLPQANSPNTSVHADVSQTCDENLNPRQEPFENSTDLNSSNALSKELENLDELFNGDDDDVFKDLKF